MMLHRLFRTRRAIAQLAVILSFFSASLPPVLAQDAREVAAFRSALGQMRAGDWEAARATAGPAGSVAQDIIVWSQLRAGKGSFAEAQAFLARRGDWPGISFLRKAAEATIDETAPIAAVLDFFIAEKPQTGAGSLAFAKALWDSGAKEAAMAEAVRGWTTLSLSAEDEARFMVDWPKTLAAHHWARLDMLLWEGRTAEAERQLARVTDGERALGEARIALREDRPGVDGAIARVPAALADDPGLAYERFAWRSRKTRYDDAIELMLERSTSAERLGRPDIWADRRILLTRWAMRERDGRTAYRIATGHHLGDGLDRNELEWLAGFVALRKLGDAETALRHFQGFKEGVESPISRGRAGYWEGRALEALGRGEEARAVYARGGQHQTAFYGLLAAEKAGAAMDARLTGASDTFPDYRQAPFWNGALMQAARLTLAADEAWLTQRFVIQLSEGLDRTGIGQLAAWAEDQNQPYLQLALAKYVLQFHGELIHRPYFPTPDIGSGNRSVPRALEMAISRRESEFNPGVVSGVGAMGLMQLMPGTARDMARRVGVDYEERRLTREMAYNTRLGSEYLAYLIETFGNNPVLIAIAYNAGPGRARQWVEAFGDPRDPSVDIIDWIEQIPFAETRNYVMRVTESLPNYRARLTGQTEAIRFTDELKRR